MKSFQRILEGTLNSLGLRLLLGNFGSRVWISSETLRCFMSIHMSKTHPLLESDPPPEIFKSKVGAKPIELTPQKIAQVKNSAVFVKDMQRKR